MYFPKNLNNFGVVLKGASVARLPQISDKFDHCYMVNNFDRNTNNDDSEYTLVAPLLKGKQIVHFVNRLDTAPLLPEHYEELGIEHIQFTKIELDGHLRKVKRLYDSYGLTCHFLPEELLGYNEYFEGTGNYTKKHPNTGVLAIIYAAHLLKPKNLWVAGLDFYQNDYLFRRPWIAPLEQQQEKMDRTDMVNHFIDVVKRNSDVNFKMITNAKLPKLDNLEVILPE